MAAQVFSLLESEGEERLVVGMVEAEGNHRKIIKTQGHFTQCS